MKPLKFKVSSLTATGLGNSELGSFLIEAHLDKLVEIGRHDGCDVRVSKRGLSVRCIIVIIPANKPVYDGRERQSGGVGSK